MYSPGDSVNRLHSLLPVRMLTKASTTPPHRRSVVTSSLCKWLSTQVQSMAYLTPQDMVERQELQGHGCNDVLHPCRCRCA